jgi:hypothetical protein
MREHGYNQPYFDTQGNPIAPPSEREMEEEENRRRAFAMEVERIQREEAKKREQR